MRKGQDKKIIYEAALKQFSKYGYKKTTLDSIAEKLNMTNANLYSYAVSKQELYNDSVAYALTKWQNKVQTSIVGIDNAYEFLYTLSEKAVTYLSEDKVFCRILKNDPNIFPMFPTVDPYEEINHKSFLLLCAALEKGKESGEFSDINVEDCAHVMFAIYKALIIETYIQTDNDHLPNYYKSAWEMLIFGILKR